MESWRNRKTLVLGRSDMIGLLRPEEYVDCVEHAFRMHGEGRVYMEPKGHIVLDRYRGEWEVMPSWIEEPEAAACKWVSIREDDARFDLPAVFSILVYTHPETGFPLATGAAGPCDDGPGVNAAGILVVGMLGLVGALIGVPFGVLVGRMQRP